MGTRKYPPLTPLEIEDIILRRGFEHYKNSGDHRFYVHEVKGKKHIVQIDMGNPLYEGHWLKLVIEESGMTREQFYCSTKSSARKLGLKKAEKEELINWAIS